MTSILLKRGTVLEHQQDDHIIPLPNTDVLIKDNKIVQIDKDIEPPNGAEIIDCANKIISPGMIDTHNHIWMTQLKARHADHTLLDYIYSGGLQSFNFEPRDIYWGQLGGCLESIDAGTTTVVDHAHMTNSPEHVTEAIAATAHSGIRSIYCYSLVVRYKSWYPLVPYPDILPTWAFEQLESLANSQPFGDGRVSLGFGFDMWFLPKERIIQIWDKARNLGIKLFTTHYCKNRIFGLQSVPELLRDYGLLKSDIIIGHGTQASASDAKILSDANIYVAAAPEVEGHLSLGQPLSFRGDVRVTFGADGHFVGPADIMSQMRSALLQARQCRNQKILDQNKFPRHNIGNSEQAFNMGTIEGARALQMESSVGSIAVGKLADIVVFDATSPSMICAAQHDPVTAIVRHATIRDVDTVIINGVIRKRNGSLLPVRVENAREMGCKSVPEKRCMDWSEIAARLMESRDRVAERLSSVDIEAGGEEFKKLAGIDSSVLI
ncbi:hypothetical protein NW752_010295 [Fusarium irregulare]|nr:hypothetical protein NW752_010295 [Fusarium irregulare]